MVDTSLAAFRLLELIALLFPVVALLVQLQHRAANRVELEVLGLVAGMSLLVLLSISFLHLSFYLISTQSLPSLLIVPLVVMSFLSLTLPLLIVLSSEQFVERVTGVFLVVLDEMNSIWQRRPPDSEPADSEPADSDGRSKQSNSNEEQN